MNQTIPTEALPVERKIQPCEWKEFVALRKPRYSDAADISIAKVENPNRLEQILSRVALVQNDPTWRCKQCLPGSMGGRDCNRGTQDIPVILDDGDPAGLDADPNVAAVPTSPSIEVGLNTSCEQNKLTDLDGLEQWWDVEDRCWVDHRQDPFPMPSKAT